LGYQLNTKMITEDDMGIPEIERFKWQEELLYTMQPLTQQESHLKERYEYLAEVIANE
jgi:hypothetical protein